MHVRRLSWAGVEVTAGAARLLLDPLENVEPLRDFLGTPRASLEPVVVDANTWAAITHLHPDHCDRELLRRLPNARVLDYTAPLWDPIEAGPFRLTPVPSHDWRGDDQVAWVVEADGRRLIHCGDTIWHGGWYEIARRFESFDVAFLPINGVLVRLDGLTPTDVPATLTPEQAVEAAVVLRARKACAIHHGLFHNPPRYVEQEDAVGRFEAAARRRGIEAVTA